MYYKYYIFVGQAISHETVCSFQMPCDSVNLSAFSVAQLSREHLHTKMTQSLYQTCCKMHGLGIKVIQLGVFNTSLLSHVSWASTRVVLFADSGG